MSFFKVQMHEARPLSWWNSIRHEIDLSPPYQRKGGLWNTQDKAYLIDSILNGFDVPKLYFADYQFGQSELNKMKLPYAVIDGKQRLEAIFQFFDNELLLDKKFVWRLNPDLRLGGFSLRDLRSLHPLAASAFENANLTVMSVFTDDESLINELFVRLNRSKSLTGAEVRNAMPGKVPDVIREVAKHLVFRETIRFSTKRAGDSNAAAKVLLFEYQGTPVSTKKRDLDEFASGNGIKLSQLELSARRTIDTLDEMEEIFLPGDPLLSSSGVFPVYYWFVRSVDPLYHQEIRRYLIDFEFRREENRAIQRSNPDSQRLVDFLTRYDTLNRSTNDAGSHRERITILLQDFRQKLATQEFESELQRAPLIRGTAGKKFDLSQSISFALGRPSELLSSSQQTV